jgi:hypothetical protein
MGYFILEDEKIINFISTWLDAEAGYKRRVESVKPNR